jgi:hypothetical protein
VAAIQHPANLQIVGTMRNGIASMSSEHGFCLEPVDQLILLAEKRADYAAFESSLLQPQTA